MNTTNEINWNELKERIRREAPDLFERSGEHENSVVSEMEWLMGNYEMAFGDAATHLRDRYHIPEPVGGHEQVDKWDGEAPPPKVDDEDWKHFGTSDGRTALSAWGGEQQARIINAVYILKLELRGQSLQHVEQQARVIFGEAPGWLRKAWKADHVYYVGETGRFNTRLKTHATGTFDDSPPPSQLTVLCDVRGAGIVKNLPSREEAEEFEDAYGKNLRNSTDEGVFVYHA